MHEQRRYQRDADQTRTVGVSLKDIMLTDEFRQGVADVRAGRPPRYDLDASELMPGEPGKSGFDIKSITNRQWNYERGRHFGTVAPRDLVVILPRAKRLNLKAVEFYRWRMLGDTL
jgi:hypothetical protein